MRNFGDRLWIGAVLAAGALGAAPTVTVTSVTQDAVRHRVTVNYELSEDAIVTASLASAGARWPRRASGATSRPPCRVARVRFPGRRPMPTTAWGTP